MLAADRVLLLVKRTFGTTRNEFKAAQDRVNAVASSGQLGIFMNGYWGHPAMRLSPDVNLLAFTHYLQALEYQRKALQVVGILGSKTPHIQNLTVEAWQTRSTWTAPAPPTWTAWK